MRAFTNLSDSARSGRCRAGSPDVAKLKWPERVEIIADMPMRPTRKVKKTELTKLL